MAQLVASASGVVLGGVAEVVGSNLARGKIFTASIGSVDSLYPSVFIYCLNLHQFLILCSSKAMMFVKLDKYQKCGNTISKHHCFGATQDQKLMQIQTVDKYRGIL